MTDHEQPAAGVALTREAIIAIIDANKYEAWTVDRAGQMADAILALRAPTEGMMSGLWGVGSWLSSALDDPKVCEEMKADIREWFDGGGHIRSKAPTDAGGAVSEAFEFPYQRTFDAIADAVTQRGGGLGVSVEAFQRSFNASGPAPQPLQQGGEVTREQVKTIICGRPWSFAAATVDRKTDAILALFASPDLGDLAGLVERLEAMEIDPHAPGLRHTSLVNPDGPEAARAIRSLAADRDKAVGLLRRSSDDLHAELLARYGDDHAHYPGIRRKFDADMEIVNEARAFLSRQKDQPHD